MAKYVDSLDWQPTNPSNNDFAASVICAGAIDTTWQIRPVGSVNYGDYTPVARFMVVDNIPYEKTVSVSFGPFAFIVPPYTRKQFRVPEGIQLVTIAVDPTAAPTVWFTETDYYPDNSNDLAIQQAALASFSFPLIVITAPAAQSASHRNAQLAFVGSSTPLTYSLFPIATTPVPNGWLSFIEVQGGQPVSIVPALLDTINQGYYTTAAPLVLRPGDSGWLGCDGNSWFFSSVPFAATTRVTTNLAMNPYNLNDDLVFMASGNVDYTLLAQSALRYAPKQRQIITNKGSGTVTLVMPNGADSVNNGRWTQSNPLILSPGDWIWLMNDGLTWQATGQITKFTAQTSVNIAAGTPVATTHNMGAKPDLVDMYLICTTASDVFAVDDVIEASPTQSIVPDSNRALGYFSSSTQFVFNLSPGFKPITVARYTTGAQITLTATSWNFYHRLRWLI